MKIGDKVRVTSSPKGQWFMPEFQGKMVRIEKVLDSGDKCYVCLEELNYAQFIHTIDLCPLNNQLYFEFVC